MSHDNFAPTPGIPLTLAPDLRLLLAPNPSPMTYLGTNTYILGRDRLAIIDPGPQSPAHLQAIMDAIGTATVSHIIVTHSHLDHAPLAKPLAALTGAPVLAFGDAAAGQSEVMHDLMARGVTGGGEGMDHRFIPDQTLANGAKIVGNDWVLEVIHTPGHTGNHICLQWGDAIFTGDHVMGWASSLVSPPDGDLTDFMTSCAKLTNRSARIYYPGHGAPITEPAARLSWLIEHRRRREAQILAVLGDGPCDIASLTAKIYHDVTPNLQKAAARNVFAHLIDLHKRQRVKADPALSEHANFTKLKN